MALGFRTYSWGYSGCRRREERHPLGNRSRDCCIEGGKTVSGIGDLMAESDDRWAKATRRAQGIADNGMGKALRAYYSVYFLLGLLALLT